MKHNQSVGRWGEETAAAYLDQRGYEILARNARTPYGEIDIIAKQGAITIFIEVKTLTSSKNFFPEQNVNARKRGHMLAVIPLFVNVPTNLNQFNINHIVDAFFIPFDNHIGVCGHFG